MKDNLITAGLLVGAMMCVVPVVASAQTASTTSTSTATTTTASTDAATLQQIQALMAQIQQLQAQIAALIQAQNNLQHQALQLIGTLHRGMHGDEVRQLQEILATDKDVFSKDNITGFFGPMTEEAVKRFQHHEGIDNVGIVGPRTLERLNELLKEHDVQDNNGDFQDGEFGDIGDSNDGEHDNQDEGGMNNRSVHDATSTGASLHDNNKQGRNNHEN